MRLGDPFPSLDGATAWLGAAPKAGDFAGRALLVHFWSAACPLCHEGARDIARWRERFGRRGLATLGVYLPRPEESAELQRTERDARESMRIEYPCALDFEKRLAARFEIEFAPGYYLFDRSHRLRHRQVGNREIASIDAIIERMLSTSVM